MGGPAGNFTLDQARGIVQGLGGFRRTGFGRRPPIRPPNTGRSEDEAGDPFAGSGGSSGGTTTPPETKGFLQPGLGLNLPASAVRFDPTRGLFVGTDGNVLPQWQQKILFEQYNIDDTGTVTPRTDTSDGGTNTTSYDDTIDRLRLAQAEDARQAEQQQFENQILLQREAQAQKEYQDALNQLAIENQFNTRDFGLEQTIADRNELGGRAQIGVSLADRLQSLANDPGNYPAYLESLIRSGSPEGVTGANTQIRPEARLGDTLGQLQQYSSAMNTDPAAVRGAYERDAGAADTFFRQRPEDLARMFPQPMAQGGTIGTGGAPRRTDLDAIMRYGSRNLRTQGPMAMQDMSTGQTVATAGEAGPESVTVQPSGNYSPLSPAPGSPTGGIPSSPATVTPDGTTTGTFTAGSAGTLQKAAALLRSSTLGSAVPPGVYEKLSRGELPLPGEIPDTLLMEIERRIPSLGQLFGAGLTSRLGSTGAMDYLAARSRYDMPGFAPFGNAINR